MDTDLFQGVLLGLLAVGVVVLIALLATLGGIRKALEQRSSEPGAASGNDTPSATIKPAGTDSGVVEAPVETGPPSTESPAAESSAAAAAATTPDTSAGAGSGTTPPVEQDTPAASESGKRADSIRSVLQEHGVGATRTSEDQATRAGGEEPAVDSAFAAHADDPQEEPFQRDGRWWFRRGDELLCYDEASGQWKPAPATEAPQQETPSAGRTVPVQEAPAAAEAASQTESMPVADQVSTFWKCPTCGAVNGSTAATCRMCFAARP